MKILLHKGSINGIDREGNFANLYYIYIYYYYAGTILDEDEYI